MVEIIPHSLGGATPITPKKGRSGSSVPQGSCSEPMMSRVTARKRFSVRVIMSRRSLPASYISIMVNSGLCRTLMPSFRKLRLISKTFSKPPTMSRLR